MTQVIEYRVRPVIRFMVTRFEEADGGGSCVGCGEFDNEDMALEVGSALADVDRRRRGRPEGDHRVLYPVRLGGERDAWGFTATRVEHNGDSRMGALCPHRGPHPMDVCRGLRLLADVMPSEGNSG